MHTSDSVLTAGTDILAYNSSNIEALLDIGKTLAVKRTQNGLGFSQDLSNPEAIAPACPAAKLGDPSFCIFHNIKYAYVGGSMANGISSTELAIEFGRAGMLGFYGAAGQPLSAIEQAIDRIQSLNENFTYGFNLIHSPSDPALENKIVDLYLNRKIRLIEASAYIRPTLALVRFRTAGIRRNAAGEIETPNRVIGKISRTEVATAFFSPPEEKLLRELVSSGALTQEQAELAAKIPVAQDVTAEADSGGHTDNRPLVNLLPTIIALRDRLQEQYKYPFALRVGAGGGIATPEAAAAAFVMGAAYVVTGSVNQACAESGTTDAVREVLANAGQADVAMAAAADMFEMGVKVQVLKRGTMFAMRANKLYEFYRTYDSFSAIPADARAAIEKDYLRDSFDNIWASTREYFLKRDPAQAERAGRDAKHKMALVFRWYLSQSSRWPINGDAARKLDYQIWCGPSMGAFNEWAKGTFLENPKERKAVTVAYNLLAGAAALIRLNSLRCQGLQVDPRLARQQPRTKSQLEKFFN